MAGYAKINGWNSDFFFRKGDETSSSILNSRARDVTEIQASGPEKELIYAQFPDISQPDNDRDKVWWFGDTAKHIAANLHLGFTPEEYEEDDE